jgi:hypothetical protein
VNTAVDSTMALEAVFMGSCCAFLCFGFGPFTSFKKRSGELLQPPVTLNAEPVGSLEGTRRINLEDQRTSPPHFRPGVILLTQASAAKLSIDARTSFLESTMSAAEEEGL